MHLIRPWRIRSRIEWTPNRHTPDTLHGMPESASAIVLSSSLLNDVLAFTLEVASANEDHDPADNGDVATYHQPIVQHKVSSLVIRKC
jgi:hypothetical protein